MKKILLCCFITALIIHADANAELKVFSGVGISYIENDSNIELAQNSALYMAKQNVVEQAGYYIRSYSKSINSQLKEDEIVAVSSKIISINSVNYSRNITRENKNYIKAIISATVDIDELNRLRKEDIENFISEYKKLENSYLYKKREYNELVDSLLAFQQYELGNIHYYNREWSEAISSYEKSLNIKPDLIESYVGLGNTYTELDEYKLALNSYDKAISLDKKCLMAYNGKGKLYYKKCEYIKALVNFNIVLALNPQYANGYHQRGDVYARLGKIVLANKDYQKEKECLVK